MLDPLVSFWQEWLIWFYNEQEIKSFRKTSLVETISLFTALIYNSRFMLVYLTSMFFKLVD